MTTDNPTQSEPCPLCRKPLTVLPSGFAYCRNVARDSDSIDEWKAKSCPMSQHATQLPIATWQALNSRAPVVAPQGDALEVIRQYLRNHALSPRAPLLVDGEAVCVCVICQFAREVMQPIFAKDRAELDRVLAEAVRDDPVGVRLTELQLERESREKSVGAQPPASSPVPPEPFRNEEGEQETTCANCAKPIIKGRDYWYHKYGWMKECHSDKIVATPAATPTPVVEREPVQCADCLAWIGRNANHTCRQQVRRNQRSTRK